MSSPRRALLSLVLCLTTPGLAAPSWAGPVVSGPAETVFDWATEACDRLDAPDAPARVWRDASGALHLIAGAETNRVSTGPALDRLRRDCAPVYRAGHADDPAAFDDRGWIAATYRHADGRLEALAHMEYHGDRRPDRCPAADYAQCWTNSLVALVSTDGGGTFSRAPGDAVVAAPALRYDGKAGRRIGYFNPSNIVRDGDFLYAFVFAERYGPQREGACLLRRPVEGGAGDWRAWSGHGFDNRFADPYRETVADPAAHACVPVEGLGRATVSGLARHIPSGQWIAVMPAKRSDADGVTRAGIWWSGSRDLIHWSPPRILIETPLLWARDCAGPAAFAYPSLIDADSSSPNFDTIGDRFWLYLTEMPLRPGCRVGPERDLIRFPVSWKP